MQIARLDAGVLIVFAFGGITIIGAMLAGWSSSNKFSLLGALRAGSQMISYEVIMGLTILGLIVIFGTVDLNSIVQQQSGTVLGVLPAWGIVYQPFAAILFMVAAIAENKRIPFDLPEAESELIAGYYTEYSAMKMGLFMFAEFIEIAIIGALFTTLFLGGYNLPYMTDAGFEFPGGHSIALPHAVVVITQLVVFLAKVFVVCSFQILVRWSLPRFRYDQVLRFAWKFMLPLVLINLVITVFMSGAGPVGSLTWRGPPYVRKKYWNEPEMSWWEKAYIFEIVRGLVITGGVFTRNMLRWMTGQKGRADNVLPGGEALGLRPRQPRQARADAARGRLGPAAMHRLQHVRNRLPGESDRDRGRLRPDRYRAPEVSGALRDRLFALHLLRTMRRGLPGGRDPHGRGRPESAGGGPRPHVARQGRTADLAAAE